MFFNFSCVGFEQKRGREDMSFPEAEELKPRVIRERSDVRFPVPGANKKRSYARPVFLYLKLDIRTFRVRIKINYWIKSMPKTTLGKWSLWLIIAMPVLFFVGSSLANSLYASTPSGNTILEDISRRPLLASTMLVGMASGILAFVTGMISIFQKKERALLVYLSTIIGLLFVLFLVGEIYPLVK